MVTTGRIISPYFSVSAHTHQRLELQIALHPIADLPSGISIQLLFCCSCSSQRLENGLARLLRQCGGRLVLTP